MNAEARALDDAFLSIVCNWAGGGPGCDEARFDELARATFSYQLERNAPYARFANALGVDAAHPPRSWRDIPAVPSAAFKDATLATFETARAELIFHTSGTTAAQSGKHYFERATLYDAALLAGFDRFMLADGARLRYLNLVPNPRYRPHSSLGYMMGHVAVLRGDGAAGYFLDDERVDAPGFGAALEDACRHERPVCIAGTAFAFVALLEALESQGRTFAAAPGSRIMETGGFKGRARAVERAELYARLERTLGIAQPSIVAEYGMTELASQYYDSPESRGAAVRVKVAPPWLRTLVVDGEGRELPEGETGWLRHVDLGNRSSAVAIETEDRGYCSGVGIVLLGRALDAPPRGCSLDAEDLTAAR
ncbi:MAG: AMP-binding protein [Vulcanimicrobiaceae bacterium]